MAAQGYNLEQTGPQVQSALDKIIGLSPATEETAGTMSASDKAKLDALPSGADLTSALAGKVDKVTGKGLSTNDFTNEDKTKVDSAYVKPPTGIPATDLASNAKPFVNGSGTGSAVLNGAGLQANGANEVAVGRNNFSPSAGIKNLFSIGVGTNDYQNNALVVKENGKAYLLNAGYTLDEEGEDGASGEYIVQDLATIVRQGYFNRLDVWDTSLMQRVMEVIGGVEKNVAYKPDTDGIEMYAGFESDGLQPFIFTALDLPIRLYSSQNTYHDYDISGKQVLFATLNWATGYWSDFLVIGNPNADWNAQSGSDAFIKNKPTIPDVTGKADKVSSPTSGNFAGLDSNGNLTDSGKKASDFQPTIDNNHKLDYGLLSNTPTIPDAQIQSDWNQSDNTAKDYIKNKPAIPAAQVQSDWNESDTSSKAYIANKPTIPAVPTPTAQDEGKVLTADDEGNMEWQTPAGGGGDSEAKEVTAAALCDLENRKFEKANLVDQYNTCVAGSHEKVGTHYALWKLYKDFLQNEEIIAAAFCQLNALGALASAVAPRYDRGTRTFAVDDCCMYENEFYRCTTAVSTPEPFDAAKWVKTDLFTEMVRRFNAI